MQTKLLATLIAGLCAQGAFAASTNFDNFTPMTVGSSRVDLQACKLEYSIVSPK